MTAKTLSSLVGGGGYWYDKAIIQHTVIPSGVTGTLLTVTCEEDERIVLTGLSPASSTQADISVAFAGVNVLSSVTIGAAAPTGSVKVGAIIDARSTVDKIEGKAGESLTISKGAGNTAVAISYSYKVQAVAYV